MGKQRKRLLCAILCLVVALSCMPVNEVKAATSVKLSATVVNLAQAQKITITVLNATGDVTWTSDNKKIATVNTGGNNYSRRCRKYLCKGKSRKQKSKMQSECVSGLYQRFQF